jgi:hypothetical protein
MSNQSDTPRISPFATDGQRTTDAECWMNYCLEAEKELTAARAEATHYEAVAQKATENLIVVTEQRDRLAEALEHTMKHMRHSLNCPARITDGLHPCNCQMEWAYDNATKALQSLTTKNDE